MKIKCPRCEDGNMEPLLSWPQKCICLECSYMADTKDMEVSND